MESNEDERKTKLGELKTTLEKHGVSQSDLDKLEERKPEEISEEARGILKNLEITKEEIERALIEDKKHKPEEYKEETLKFDEEPENAAEKTDKSEEISNPREEIEKFLREKSMSQSFINTFLKIGFTDEFHREAPFLYRLLNAMGFTIEEIKELRRLCDLEIKGLEENDSLVSLPSSSDDHLSFDGLYLKRLLSKPLAQALREIIAKKPFDPIEYLGHWLLNYKICEEMGKRRKEFELELMIEREKMKLRQEDEAPSSMNADEERDEGLFDDWRFL
ncbi:PREDICTED: uncharacterized protein LOC108551052 [Eufriesea mexicana]|uniref:uncharacterized protein LOC108551052 n=1 Tax=Eufriesea mexicana TaxID=516756 RepID=UPI00083C5A84|nr:PREDICTED: uncharacterized protein LOC108551052 [Eufriesea mexicana]